MTQPNVYLPCDDGSNLEDYQMHLAKVYSYLDGIYSGALVDFNVFVFNGTMGNFPMASLLQKVHIYTLSHTHVNTHHTHTYDHLRVLTHIYIYNVL